MYDWNGQEKLQMPMAFEAGNLGFDASSAAAADPSWLTRCNLPCPVPGNFRAGPTPCPLPLTVPTPRPHAA